AARRAGAGRLSDRRRPGAWARSAADAAPAAGVLDPGGGQPVRASAGVVPLAVVLGPARERRVRAGPPAREVHARRGAGVRGVRSRSRVLLGDSDRAAVVGCGPGTAGER